MENKRIKAYKGFNKDMTCRGFQYEEGKEYHTDKAMCRKEGFHACEHPLDVLAHYAPNNSVYHNVELFGVNREGGKKIAATDIKIGARLDIVALVSCAIEYVKQKCDKEHYDDGYRGASSATGYYSCACTTGLKGLAIADNSTAIAIAWGIESKARGKLGAHLVLSEWENRKLIGTILIKVDGEKIKEDTFYQLKNGEIVEAE